MVFGSGAGLAGGPNMVAYGATKAFDMVFAEALWSELHDKGVDVLGLILGKTNTPALRRLEHSRGHLSSEDAAPTDADSVDRVIAEAFENLGNGPTLMVGDMMRAVAPLLCFAEPQRGGQPHHSSPGRRHGRRQLRRAKMDAATELREIEAIKQLKARYCRYLDSKDWAAWRAIFADDFVSDTAESGGRVIIGADEFVPTFARRSENRLSPRCIKCTPRRSSCCRRPRPGVCGLCEDVVRLAPGVNLNGYVPLPRDLRKGRRAVANQVVEAHPASRGHLQSCFRCVFRSGSATSEQKWRNGSCAT